MTAFERDRGGDALGNRANPRGGRGDRDLNEHRESVRLLHLMGLARELLTARLDLESTIAATAAAPVPVLAEGCTVFVRGRDQVLRARISRHSDDRVERGLNELGEAYADPDAPLLKALSFAPVVIGWDTFEPIDRYTVGAVGLLGHSPWLVLALHDQEGELLGALRLVITPGATPDQQWIDWASDLAVLSGPAIARALRATSTMGALETLAGGLAPDSLPEIPGFAFKARYLPGTSAVGIGGDWYQVMQAKGRVLIALGDAAGHGVNAAVAMAQASSALRAFLTAGRPRSAMYKLDQYLHSLIGPGFVTLCMVDVNPKTRKARLTNAGHMPPIHVTRKGIRRLNKGRGSPLGVGSVDRISPARVRFRRDDRLFLYTDGLVERRGDSIDKGIARLYWVIDEAPEDLDDACDHILEQMRPPGGFEDDVALLAVRFTRRRDG